MTRVCARELERTMTRSICRSLGIGETVAGSVMDSLISDMRQCHGGAEFYIPVAVKKTDVVDAVRAAFTGTNAQEVCDRFGIGRTTLYRYLGKTPE